MDLHSLAHPSPTTFLILAGVLLIFFIFGLKKKPEPNDDGKWVWWSAMTVFGICIVYLTLRGFGIDVLGIF
jgi:hypothetical protein